MANRFWVGGTGDWSDTAHWSATSGGASGVAIPTAADDVFFDSASSGASYTATINTGATRLARSITCAAPATGDLTLAGTAALTVSGSITLYAGMTWSYSGAYTMNGAGTVTSAGKTWSVASFAFSGNLAFVVGDSLNIGAAALTYTSGGASSSVTLTAGITLTAGAMTVGSGNQRLVLNCNSATLALASFTVSATNPANLNINCGTSVWNLTGNWSWTTTTSNGAVLDLASCTINCAVWSFTSSASTNSTLITNTASTINCSSFTNDNRSTPSAASPNRAIYGSVASTGAFVAGTTQAAVFQGTVSCVTFSSLNLSHVYVGRVTISPAVATGWWTVAGNITFTGGLTITPTVVSSALWSLTADVYVTGATLILTGQNANLGRLTVISSVEGSPRILSAPSATLTDTQLHGITCSGAGIPFTGTRIGDIGNNTGVTFTAPVTRYYVGNGGSIYDPTHISASSGGASGASTPLPQDTLNINGSSISSGGQTITAELYGAPTINATGVTNTPTLNFSASALYWPGGLTTSASGITVSSTADVIVTGTDATWTTNNSAIVFSGRNVTIYKVGGQTLTTSGAFQIGGSATLTITQGGFAAGGAVNIRNIVTNSGLTRSLAMGSGAWTIRQWTLVNDAGLTFSADTSTMTFTTGAFVFASGGMAYYDVVCNGTDGSSLTSTGASSFRNITVSATSGTMTFVLSGLTGALTVSNGASLTLTGSGIVYTFSVTSISHTGAGTLSLSGGTGSVGNITHGATAGTINVGSFTSTGVITTSSNTGNRTFSGTGIGDISATGNGNLSVFGGMGAISYGAGTGSLTVSGTSAASVSFAGIGNDCTININQVTGDITFSGAADMNVTIDACNDFYHTGSGTLHVDPKQSATSVVFGFRDFYHTGSGGESNVNIYSIRSIYHSASNPMYMFVQTIQDVFISGPSGTPGTVFLSGPRGQNNYNPNVGRRITGAFTIENFPQTLCFGGGPNQNNRIVFTSTPDWALGGGVGALGGGRSNTERLKLRGVEAHDMPELVWPDVEAHLDYVDLANVTVSGVSNLTWGRHSTIGGGVLGGWPSNTAVAV